LHATGVGNDPDDMAATSNRGSAGSRGVPREAAAEPAPTPPLLGSMKRAFGMFRAHGMTDWGASMTYYLVMSLFPALLVGISLLGLFGQQSLVTDSVEYLRDAGAPAEAVDAVEASLSGLVESSGAKVGLGLVLGIALGINGASGAFGAAGRALNKVFGVDEERGFVRKKASDLGWTSLVILLGIVALVCVFLGGSVAKDIFGTIGLGDTAATVWTYARWLVALAAMMVLFAVIYAFAPDLEHRRFQWISPGAALGVVIWLLASGLFFLYVSNFGNYGATYGAFAGAILLLLWLYITSLAFLLGGELNGEIERAQIAGRGGPPPPSAPPSPGAPTGIISGPPATNGTNDITEKGPGSSS
jgi:membrane protein